MVSAFFLFLTMYNVYQIFFTLFDKGGEKRRAQGLETIEQIKFLKIIKPDFNFNRFCKMICGVFLMAELVITGLTFHIYAALGVYAIALPAVVFFVDIYDFLIMVSFKELSAYIDKSSSGSKIGLICRRLLLVIWAFIVAVLV